MKKKLITVVCVLGILSTGKVFAGTDESLLSVKNTVQGIPESSFKNGDVQLKTAFLDDIEGVNSILVMAADETEISEKNSLSQDALNTVNKLISKTDGCSANNTPDENDWIINCDDALSMNNVLKTLASDITALIQ